MLDKSAFNWQKKMVNNIPENPLDSEFCIVDLGNGTGKLYMVKPLYAQSTTGLYNSDAGYKYFVFFDCNVRLPSESEKKDFWYGCEYYAGYVMTSKTLIAVFDTMDDAKERAYTQYSHHFGYVLPHVVKDMDAETRNHFVVQGPQEENPAPQ